MDQEDKVDLDTVVDIICCLSDKIVHNSDQLTKLDSKIGDSDHGENMKRGFQAIKNNKDKLEEKNTIKEVLVEAGEELTFSVGGSAGPLFGNLFIEVGKSCAEKQTFTMKMLPPALDAALKGVQELGGAEVGDKTMVDTLFPVVRFLQDNDLQSYDCGELFLQIKRRAKEGLESTREIAAKKGRARYLDQRSKGHLDPGAFSCYLMFEAIEEFYNSPSKTSCGG